VSVKRVSIWTALIPVTLGQCKLTRRRGQRFHPTSRCLWYPTQILFAVVVNKGLESHPKIQCRMPNKVPFYFLVLVFQVITTIKWRIDMLTTQGKRAARLRFKEIEVWLMFLCLLRTYICAMQ